MTKLEAPETPPPATDVRCTQLFGGGGGGGPPPVLSPPHAASHRTPSHASRRWTRITRTEGEFAIETLLRARSSTPASRPSHWPRSPLPPRRDDLEQPLRRLVRSPPLDRRARREEQPSHRREVPALPVLGSRSLGGPDQWLPLELPVAHVHGRALRDEHAHRIGPPLHRGRMQRGLADPLVGAVRVEATGQHRLERPHVPALGRPVKRDVVIVGD